MFDASSAQFGSTRLACKQLLYKHKKLFPPNILCRNSYTKLTDDSTSICSINIHEILLCETNHKNTRFHCFWSKVTTNWLNSSYSTFQMTNRSNGLNKVEARPPTKENDSLRTTTRSTCQVNHSWIEFDLSYFSRVWMATVNKYKVPTDEFPAVLRSNHWRLVSKQVFLVWVSILATNLISFVSNQFDSAWLNPLVINYCICMRIVFFDLFGIVS